MTDTRLTGARPFATRSPERDWVSVHVHYQTGLDRLLTEAVDPLIRRLGEEGLHNGWFFLRYWDGGTHLRLRIRPSSPALAGRVGEQLSEELAGFLRVCPSPTVMSQETTPSWLVGSPPARRWKNSVPFCGRTTH